MTNLQSLTVEQLRKVVAIKEQIETLTAQLAAITEGHAPASDPKRRRRKMSPATRARMAAAQQKRWAKVKGHGRKAGKMNGVKKKRQVSAATRAKLAASAKIRWAKARAAGEAAL